MSLTEIELIKTIKDFHPTLSVGLTFNWDTSFYEGYFLPTMKKIGCRRNAVFCDGRMYNTEVMKGRGASFLSTGEGYLLFPMAVPLAFHPKIYLFKNGAGDFLVFIGSGNLTYRGFYSNKEFFFEASSAKEDLSLLLAVRSFLFSTVLEHSFEGLKIVKNWLEPWPLDNANDKNGILITAGESSVLDQLRGHLPPGTPQRLSVLSPFFDYDFGTLFKLDEVFHPDIFEIVLPAQPFNGHPSGLKDFLASLGQRGRLKRLEEDGYFHAKVLEIELNKEIFVLAGSSNMTRPALLQAMPNSNVEANIYFRSDASVVHSLSSTDVTVDEAVSRIVDFKGDEVLKQASTVPRFAGADFYPGAKGRIYLVKGSSCPVDVEILCGSSLAMAIAYPDELDQMCLILDRFPEDACAVRPKTLQNDAIWTTVVNLAMARGLGRQYVKRIEVFRSLGLDILGDDGKRRYWAEFVEYLEGEIMIGLATPKQEILSLIERSQEDQLHEEGVAVSLSNAIISQRNTSRMQFSPFEAVELLLGMLSERKSVHEVRMEDDDGGTASRQDSSPSVMTSNELRAFERLFRRWRRRYRDITSPQSLMNELCLFFVLSLPQVSFLEKSYVEDRDRIYVVDHKDWNAFLTLAAKRIGMAIFNGSTDRWPLINIEDRERHVFTRCVAAVFYVFSSTYFLMKASALRDPLFEEGQESAEKTAATACLAAVLLHNSGIPLSEIRVMATDLMKEWPYRIGPNDDSHVSEFFQDVMACKSHDYDANPCGLFGRAMSWSKEKGFQIGDARGGIFTKK